MESVDSVGSWQEIRAGCAKSDTLYYKVEPPRAWYFVLLVLFVAKSCFIFVKLVSA